MSIATPEGLELDLVLAGVGSRVVAGLLDLLVRGALALALALATVVARPGGGVTAAVWSVGLFVLIFGYDVFFELTAGGQTPGKRWSGLRVVSLSGGSVGAGSSVVRNLLRLVDVLPGAYLVGIVMVLVTGRNQRVGDLLAGTLVVRERRNGGHAADTLPVHELRGSWDVSAVTAEEVATVRSFLARRGSLTPEARQRLALELAVRLHPKVVGPFTQPPPEAFLEDVVAAKAGRG